MPRKRDKDQELERSLKELDAKITRLLDSPRRSQEDLDKVLEELRERARRRRRPRIIAQLGVR
jgi:chaperonin cofactor prefoldin